MSDFSIRRADAGDLGREPSIQRGAQLESLASQLTALRKPQAQSSGSPTAANSPRLVSAAHQFEASMMKELLAPLQPGKDGMFDDEESNNSNAALTEFASEALGKAISEHGGLGIATRILQQLSASNRSSSTAVMGAKDHSDPNSSSK
jgi:Rod binding domain-containing protein